VSVETRTGEGVALLHADHRAPPGRDHRAPGQGRRVRRREPGDRVLGPPRRYLATGPALGRLPEQVSPERGLLMIGGGTGIAPIQAILHGLEMSGPPPRSVIVYYGARRWEGLHALDNLRSMSYRNRWLDVVPVVEEPPPATGPR